MPTFTQFSPDTLHNFTARVFEHFGVPQEDATTAADVLAYADLRGIDSHGVARLRTYVDMLTLGRINPTPTIRITRERASVATVDGDNGLGLVVGPKANDIAITKARESGSGWVSVCNTNHYGAAGFYATKVVNQGYIGWSMTNTTKLVAPFQGAQRMLGTNPICIGFPAKEELPIIVDMASCAVAYGKIEIAGRAGENIPTGWAIDHEGCDTTDPAAMVNGGALLPLGSDADHGGHKGYCLAVAVDLLCGPLSGANWGPFCPPFALRQEIPERSVGKGIGHFFGAMDIGGFIDPDEFKAQVDEYRRVMLSTKPAPNTEGPILPGDPEETERTQRITHGIPVIEAVVSDLRDIERETGVTLT